MTRHLALCLAIASSLFVSPRPADAAVQITHVFNAVHAVESPGSIGITVTGILAGQTNPTTVSFYFLDSDHAQRCERLALVALTNPGKYKFHIGGYDSGVYEPGCKVSLLTP